MSSIKTVVKFELVRVLKKPSFWVAAALLPLLVLGYVLLAGWQGSQVGRNLEEATDLTDAKIAVLDQSGLLNIDPEFTKLPNLQQTDNADQAINDVKSGKLDQFWQIPEDLSKTPIQIYVNSETPTLFANHTAAPGAILKSSVLARLDPNQAIVVSDLAEIHVTEFSAGQESNTLGQMIVPIIALIIFYLLVVLFGNRLLMATVEEKENRITEMLLTSVSATHLIIGKLLALVLLGFLQLLILVMPLLMLYLIASQLNLGGINLSALLPEIIITPWAVISSLLLLFTGYLLFAGLCASIGSLVPSAKEAGGYMGPVMIAVMLPLITISAFMAPEPSSLSYILSYFPISAPIALLLRNAAGNLPVWEVILGTANLLFWGSLLIIFATRTFKYGAVNFSEKIKLTRALRLSLKK